MVPWVDKYEIGVGDGLLQTIEKGIAECAFVVLVISSHSVTSDWVKKELDLALKLQEKLGHKVLLSVLKEKIDIPRELEFLKAVKYADFSGIYDYGLQELLAALHA